MKSQLAHKPQTSLGTFFGLVFLISALLWLLAAVTKNSLPDEISADLPLSTLMMISPISVALFLSYRENGMVGLKQLWKRSFDRRGIQKKAWYLPVLFLMPAVMLLVNAIKVGIPAPTLDTQFTLGLILISCLLIFLEAVCEEVGWQGYAFGPMQARWNALIASLILGSVWALWHLVPFLQMGKSANWIMWQSLNMVATRVIIVWIYNNNGKSVFAAILYHSMNNVSTLLFQDLGLIYDPVWSTIILIAIAMIISLLWGPKTLSSFRFARSGKLAQSSSS